MWVQYVKIIFRDWYNCMAMDKGWFSGSIFWELMSFVSNNKFE